MRAGRITRVLEFALCFTALVWAAAATAVATRAAQGFALRFNLLPAEPLLEALFLLFLAILGFRALDWIATRGAHTAQVFPLPRRRSSASEWSTGAAIGWGLALAVVSPLLVTLNLHARLIARLATVPGILLSLCTLLVAALAQEVVFRGYPFQRLTRAVGPTAATLLLSFGFAFFLLSATSSHTVLGLVDGTLFGIVLSIAWLRTHALWIGWGLHFAYRAILAVALGLPIAGRAEFASLVDTYATGPRWLSGGSYGPDGALLTAGFLLVAALVLYRVTRDWAWAYTHAPIVAAGYEVAIAPPAAHVAMEKSAAPLPLVQILPTTPQTRSVESPSDLTPR